MSFVLTDANRMKEEAADATAADFARVNDEILLPADFPVAPACQTLVFGCAPVAFLVAHTVELAKRGLLGAQIYFTGGLTVAEAEPELAALAVQAGFPRPFEQETQAQYAARCFLEQMEGIATDLPPRIYVETSNASRNTEENIREAMRDGFMRDKHGRPVTAVNMVGQAYHAPRFAGTALRIAREEEQLDPAFKTPVIIPHAVWLQGSGVDINRDNWHRQPGYVRNPFVTELHRLTCGLKDAGGNYYDLGYCHKIDRTAWRARIEALQGPGRTAPALRGARPAPAIG